MGYELVNEEVVNSLAEASECEWSHSTAPHRMRQVT